jgi:DNA-binding transcriptional MerR regulator
VAVLSIGEFSRFTHLSVRTLRRYHDAGLLVPAEVDSATGYRYYSAEQIPTAQVIHRLRELDVPLADVRDIVGSADPVDRAALVADHLGRLEAELDAVVADPVGAPGGLYDNALFEDGRGRLLVYRQTSEPPHVGRVRATTLPAVELAVTTHRGAHDDIEVTYGELGRWVVANAWRTEIGWPVFRVGSPDPTERTPHPV